MHSILEDTDVYIDYVSILDGPVVRDAVTDDFIDTGADGLGELVIVEWTGISIVVDDELVDCLVYFVSSHSFLDCPVGYIQSLPPQKGEFLHLLDVFISVDQNGPLVRSVHLFSRDGTVVVVWFLDVFGDE